MKVKEATFSFRGYKFTFTPGKKKKMFSDRYYIQWKIIVEWRGKRYRSDYWAFTPSAAICRRLKRTKFFLQKPLKK